MEGKFRVKGEFSVGYTILKNGKSNFPDISIGVSIKYIKLDAISLLDSLFRL